MNDPFLIKKPRVTEKAADLNVSGKYVFLVKKNATKPEVKKAIRAIYKVDSVAVNIINKVPKKKRMGAVKGSQAGYKKAIVTLKAGQKIEIH